MKPHTGLTGGYFWPDTCGQRQDFRQNRGLAAKIEPETRRIIHRQPVRHPQPNRQTHAPKSGSRVDEHCDDRPGARTGAGPVRHGAAWCGWRDSNPHEQSSGDFKSPASTIPPHPRRARPLSRAEQKVQYLSANDPLRRQIRRAGLASPTRRQPTPRIAPETGAMRGVNYRIPEMHHDGVPGRLPAQAAGRHTAREHSPAITRVRSHVVN